MARIEEFSDVRDKELVRNLIKEKIDQSWLKGLLLGKKGICGDIRSGISLADDFEIYVWDNLTQEQQKKVVESLNLIIEEDLYKPVEFGSYYQNVVDMACTLEKKMPGAINSELLIKWKNEGFPNLAKPKNYTSSLQAEFTRKIEMAFKKI